VVRVENVLEEILQSLAPYTKVLKESLELLKEEAKKHKDWNPEKSQEFEKTTPFFAEKDKEIELKIQADKLKCIATLLEKTGHNYFQKKKPYVELCKALGIED